jgi:hypothetical protein
VSQSGCGLLSLDGARPTSPTPHCVVANSQSDKCMQPESPGRIFQHGSRDKQMQKQARCGLLGADALGWTRLEPRGRELWDPRMVSVRKRGEWARLLFALGASHLVGKRCASSMKGTRARGGRFSRAIAVLANGIHAHSIILRHLLVASCLCTAWRLPPFPASAGEPSSQKSPAIQPPLQRQSGPSP